MIDIISRIEAKAVGVKRYFTGKPCPKKHVSERFTSDRSCCACRAKNNSDPKNKSARKRYAKQHPEQMKQYCNDWEINNREKRRQWRETPEYKLAQKLAETRWVKDNPELVKEKHRKFSKIHPGKMNAKTAKRRSAKLQRTPAWADFKAISEIYEESARLTEETGILHHVDHDIPLQGEFVSGLHCETNLVILTAIDNLSKGNKHDG